MEFFTPKLLKNMYFIEYFLVSAPAENLKVSKTFVQWMNEHEDFRTICEDGKGTYPSKY